MGLLDSITEFVKTPEGQGLLSAAFSGAAASRGNNPWNTAGAAGLGGLHGYNNAINQGVQRQESEQQAQYRAAQMKKMQAEQDRQARLDEAQQRALAGLSPEQRAAVDMGVPMADIWKRNNPEAKYQPMGNQLLKIQGSDVMPVFEGQKKAPEGFEYIDGKLTPIQAYWDQKRSVAQNGRAPTPFFQFLPTAGGYAVGDARTGNISQAAIDGKPVIKASDSPELQGQIAGAKEGEKVKAKTQVEAAFDAPRVIQVAETAIKHVDDLLAHPGFTQAVGKSSMLGVQKVPGTDAYDFMNRLDQVKGGAFLEAFNQLKGGGQITEVEGKKATDALARMNNATSEPEFKAAAEDFKATVKLGMNRAKMKAGSAMPVQSSQPSGAVRKFNPKTGRIE